MIKRVCDRCSADLSCFYTMNITRSAPYMVTEICSYDLCDDCWEDFMGFLKQKPPFREGEEK